MVRPIRYLKRRSQIERRPDGSTPADGSSSITVLEPPTNAIATESLRCMPPERFFESSFFLSTRPLGDINVYRVIEEYDEKMNH